MKMRRYSIGRRRSSSSAQNPVIPDPKGSQLLSRVDDFEAGVTALDKQLSAALKASAQHGQRACAAAESMRDAAAREPDRSLAEAMAAVSDAMLGVEALRTALVQERSDVLVLQPLRLLKQRGTVPARALLRDRADKRAQLLQADTAFSAVAAERSAATAGRFRQLVDEQERTRHVENTADVAMARFEGERVSSMRAVLAELVHARMAYHLRAVQTLTAAAAAVEAVDAGAAKDALEQQLHWLSGGGARGRAAPNARGGAVSIASSQSASMG